METARFERLVAKAVDSLPDEFRTRLENIDVVVADQPTRQQLAKFVGKRGETLLGLYEGVPLTGRGQHYGLVVPDKITIFQRPIEARYRDEARITALIGRVVRHEIAHHFGIGDGRLKELGGY
jgi:predicted Zn-dependent protease with MMP-like domain